ncbi:MAG TPA: hypothetical protein VEB42_00230 [Chitinophagaceae bacterium]|nr:hypothetical protein [Chitinophagaceae bacterium]
MKLPLLLSQYLREHQQLRLPGLGSFYASSAAAVSDADTQPTLNVRFERKPVTEAEEGLVDFIRQKTGKIRPLALADLDSYIENGLQLLNIGKPFYIEGIGTIMKTREGTYNFEARELAATRDESSAERSQRAKAEQAEKKRSVFEDEKYSPSSNPWQKIVVAALILGGLAIVVLGGYYLYTQNNDKAEIREQFTPPMIVDTANNKQDTLNMKAVDSSRSYAAAGYKFILETTNSKKRALRRYAQLKSYFLPIKLETADSTAFKLYFLIPSSASDTARIRDSLSRYYMSRVRIEL